MPLRARAGRDSVGLSFYQLAPLVISTKKEPEGKLIVSKSRSIKAGKIEDAALPNNIAAALNNALKVKAKDIPKK